MWWLAACAPDPGPVDTGPETGGDAEVAPFVPDFEGYPRFVAAPEDRPAIAARLAATTGDAEVDALYATLAADLRAACDADLPAPDPDDYDVGLVRVTAEQAKACAFLGWVEGDPARVQRGVDALARVPTDAFLLLDVSRDVHLHAAAASAVSAADLLLGAGASDDDVAPARELARSQYARWVEDQPIALMLSGSNHNLKFDGGLGAAGLVFDDDPDAPRWIAQAMADGSWLQRDVLGNPGAGEGPYYQMYGDFEWLPFQRAWHRLVGPGDHRFVGVCGTRPPDACPAGEEEVWPDPYDQPAVQDAWRWNLELRRPDGLRPPIDDGLPVGYPSALLADVDPAYGWDFATQSPPLFAWAGDLAADVLAAWDGARAEPAGSPCRAWPEAGTATIRTGWGPQDAWALLLAEPPGRATPTGHEKADANTLQYFARGVDLAIGPGYAGWEARESTAAYADHNGITLDDVGPPTGLSGGYTVDWDVTDPCRPAARVVTSRFDWTRRLALAGEDLVVDDVFAGTGVQRWRLHSLNREGRGTFEARPWGAVIRRPGVTLVAVVRGPPGTTFAVEEGHDAHTYGQIRAHDTLVATATVTDAGRWFAVLAARDADAEPVVEVRADAIVVDGVAYAP